MTHDAVIDKLDEYIHTVAIQAIDELDPSRVVNVDLPAESIKSAMRDDIRHEMIGIKSSFSDQMIAMIEYAETEESLDEHVEGFLAVDVFYEDFVGDDDRREAFRDDLEQYFVRGSSALQPLIRSETDDFWSCFVETYTREELDDFMTLFRRSEVVAPYIDDLRITMELDTGLPIEEVEYTEEAVRVFDEAERYLREIIRDEADRAYGD